MMPRLSASLCVAAATLIACDDPVHPSREAPYEFAIQCPAPGCTDSAGNLRVLFRWPATALPVRIWVQPGSDLQHAASQAIALWEQVAVYGEFRGVIVSDSSAADVVVLLGAPFSSSPTNGSSTAVIGNDCGSFTIPKVALDTTIVLPFLTVIQPRAGRGLRDLQSCYEATVAHELGHALGLLVHSPDEEDLMNGRPRFAQLSLRDRATFARLYHSTPTVRLPSGR